MVSSLEPSSLVRGRGHDVTARAADAASTARTARATSNSVTSLERNTRYRVGYISCCYREVPPVNLLKLSKVNMALSKVLPSFKHGYKHTTSTLQARYKHATSMLQAEYKHAYRSTQACDKQAASAPQAGHKRVSRSKFNETLVIFFMCVAAQECTEGALDADDEAHSSPRAATY